MKKLTIAILMLFSFSSIASAEVGINVGVSGQMGVFTAEAEESIGTNNKGKDDAIGVFGYGSIFVEKTLGDYLAVGIDYVPSSLSSETVTELRADKNTANPAGYGNVKTQTIKVDLEDLTTYYLTLNVTENLYAKLGYMEVDVITKETLGTGGSYGNTSLDGTVFGLGYNKDLTNGLFVRAEGNYMDIDGVSLASSGGETKTIKITDVGGVSGKISIGKTF